MSILTEAYITGRFDLSVVWVLVGNSMPSILASNTTTAIGGRLTTQAHIHITYVWPKFISIAL